MSVTSARMQLVKEERKKERNTHTFDVLRCAAPPPCEIEEIDDTSLHIYIEIEIDASSFVCVLCVSTSKIYNYMYICNMCVVVR